MSNHSLPAREPDPPFSHKSVVSITHELNICSKTLIQLFVGHVVSPRPMKRQEKIHRMITQVNCRIEPAYRNNDCYYS